MTASPSILPISWTKLFIFSIVLSTIWTIFTTAAHYLSNKKHPAVHTNHIYLQSKCRSLHLAGSWKLREEQWQISAPILWSRQYPPGQEAHSGNICRSLSPWNIPSQPGNTKQGSDYEPIPDQISLLFCSIWHISFTISPIFSFVIPEKLRKELNGI